MTAPDGPPRVPPGLPPEGDDGEVTLRRRIAARWTGLGPTAKAGVIVLGGVATTVAAGILIALSNSRATAAADADEEMGIDVGEEHTEPLVKTWTNHAGGYFTCSHRGCAKKVTPYITGHDCCGRCRQARWDDCTGAAQRDYSGPGSFAHNYFEALLYPGICATCSEPPEAHTVVYDTQIGERR